MQRNSTHCKEYFDPKYMKESEEISTKSGVVCEQKSDSSVMQEVAILHQALVAAREGDLQTLKSMQSVLERSQLINDDFGANVVHYAARNGSHKILRFLVNSCHMSATIRNKSGALPAHEAAAFGKLTALSWLLQNTDTSLTERDNYGQTYLHLAARVNDAQTPRPQGGPEILNLGVVQGLYNVGGYCQNSKYPSNSRLEISDSDFEYYSENGNSE